MKWRRSTFSGRDAPFRNHLRPSVDKIPRKDGIGCQEDRRLASHQQKGGTRRYFSALSPGSASWKVSGKLRHIHFQPVLGVGVVRPPHLPTSRFSLAGSYVFSHCLRSSFSRVSTRVALALGFSRDISPLSDLAPCQRHDFRLPSRLLDSIPSLSRRYSSSSSYSSTSYPGPVLAAVIHWGCPPPPSRRLSLASHSKSSFATQALHSSPSPASSSFHSTPSITGLSFFTRGLQTNAASVLGEDPQGQKGQTRFPVNDDTTPSHAAGEWASVCTRDTPTEVESSSPSLTPRCSVNKRRLLNVVNRVQKGDVLNGLKVAGLDWEGRGLVRLLVREWRQVLSFSFFRALPGEKVTLRIDQIKRREDGRKLEIASLGTTCPSESERTPICRHFDRNCGGCSLLHMKYDGQVEEKENLLRTSVKEHLPNYLRVLEPMIPCQHPDELMYRNRSDFILQLRNGPRLGHFHFSSPEVIDIPQCPKLSLAIRRVYKAARAHLLPALKDGQLTIFNPLTGQGLLKNLSLRSAVDSEGKEKVLVNFICQHTESLPPALSEVAHALATSCSSDLAGVVANPVIWPGKEASSQSEVVLYGVDHVLQSLDASRKVIVRITARTSFLTNAFLLKIVCDKVLDLGKVQPGQVVWEFFAGSGVFSVLLADRARRVFAFDSRLENLSEVEENFFLNSVENGSAFLADFSSRSTLAVLSQYVSPGRWDIPSLDKGVSSHDAMGGALESPLARCLFDPVKERRRRQKQLNSLAYDALRLYEQETNDVAFDGEDAREDFSSGESLHAEAGTTGEQRSRGEILPRTSSGERTNRNDGNSQRGDSGNFGGHRSISAESTSALPFGLPVSFPGLESPDILILQPPRLGCDKASQTLTFLFLERPCASVAGALRRWLRRTAIPRIVYVSRYPPSMLRDIVPLTYLGYTVECIQPLDVFPHSASIMCIAGLKFVGRADAPLAGSAVDEGN
ncbi:family rna methyltransferase [Cystoisospora suis]|uniref:Family rna methyltransferase n=1 Tax=Cystoisospora suis TaxID=483139 RepID=A0A2C6LF38_9APIC|nr:family rna methyltransferase [Cystoisospora suis]